ncbi:MAG: zinc ABC transporter substrate-binding protein, partial [Clostridia bacterium]|nr:zinc ABC transporter substrate-binding protein [Clostridia bacterium]
MKKAISLLLSLFIICSLFASCGIGTPADETGRLKIVATVFPEYDWIKNILGEQSNNVDLTLLLDNGVDLHSYQPTADD